MGFFIFLVIVAGIVFLLILRKKAKNARNIPVYVEYYAKKRREFPWLENWIKENGDPAVERATEFLAGKTPGDYECFEDGSGGLTLECPSCHCPHSWVMTQKEIIFDSASGSRNDLIRSGVKEGSVITRMSGVKEGEKTKEEVTYYGRVIKDFECLNCGHTEHNEYETAWLRSAGKEEPESGVFTYNPPKPAWGYDKILEKQKNASNDLYEQSKKEEAQQTSAPSSEQGISESLLKAAELGNKDAQGEIAVKYLLGQGVEADEEKAALWLEKWWYQDHDFNFAEALYYLADSYEFSNPANAVAIFEKWAERCDEDENFLRYSGFERLGKFYQEGEGVPMDIKKARYWYQQAADLGNDDAKKALKKLK